MKLLSFLGKGKYDLTRYIYRGQEYDSPLSIAASCRFLNPDTVILFLTEDAQQEQSTLLEKEIPTETFKREIYAVPEGNNEAELWSIFQQISQSVSPGEEVAFDVTNGLRSFPLVGLLAAAFLRSGLDVKLKAVLYGAFDLRDKTKNPNETQMMDLSPMITLLDWASAADRFNRTGNARYLSALVRDQKKTLALSAKGNPALLGEVGALGSLATGLTEISQAIHLIRSTQVMETSADLPRRIQNAQPALKRAAAALPFGLLLDNVAERFTPLGLSDPEAEENLLDLLERQRRLMRRYTEWELWAQAATLAREWLITWFMARVGMEGIFNYAKRDEMAERINSESQAKRSGTLSALAAEEAGQEGLKLWDMIKDMRNDINHAGMRDCPGDPANFIGKIEEVLGRIENLPLPEAP